jgi:hypothetical protein
MCSTLPVQEQISGNQAINPFGHLFRVGRWSEGFLLLPAHLGFKGGRFNRFGARLGA